MSLWNALFAPSLITRRESHGRAAAHGAMPLDAYEVIELIGEGSFGKVRIARCPIFQPLSIATIFLL